MMIIDPSDKVRVQKLLTEIQQNLEIRALAPFGDGPLEVELAKKLQTEVKEPARLKKIIEFSLRTCFSRVIDPEAKVLAFRQFAGVAFVARFADVAVDDRTNEAVLALLLELSRVNLEAQFALADFIRTLARHRSTSQSIELEIERHDNPEIVTAYIELLVSQNDRKGIDLLNELLDTGYLNSSLLWNLVHDERFIILLQAHRDALTPLLLEKTSVALREMDPSGSSLETWLKLIEAVPKPKSWHNYSYRELEPA